MLCSLPPCAHEQAGRDRRRGRAPSAPRLWYESAMAWSSAVRSRLSMWMWGAAARIVGTASPGERKRIQQRFRKNDHRYRRPGRRLHCRQKAPWSRAVLCCDRSSSVKAAKSDDSFPPKVRSFFANCEAFHGEACSVLCRSLHCDTPQEYFANRRTVQLLQCRQWNQPVESHVQAGTVTRREAGPWLQDGFLFLPDVALPRRAHFPLY